MEQYGIGGRGSVRGYRQDQVLTDSGVFASLEVRVPVLQIPEWNSTVQLTPFFDYGVGWNRSGRDDPEQNELASLGLGVLLQVSDRLTARLDWGIPLIDIDNTGNTWQEEGITFTIQGRLF